MSHSRREFLRTVALAAAGVSLARVASATTLLRLPYVQNVRRTRATIRWSTREADPVVLSYTGDDDQTGRVTSQVRAFLPAETGQTAAWYRHEVALSDLTPGTNYRYGIALNGRALTLESMQFRTSGVAPFQFLAFGDSGTDSKEQKLVSQLLLKRSPDFILHTGDLVYPTGTWDRYEALYFDYYREIMKNIPFFPCPGNHDYYELKCIPYRAMNSVPEETVPESDLGRYYSFDWGNAHFVSLDSNDCLADAASGIGGMLEWMDKDLSQTNKFWRIVLLHHPAYSAGNHSEEIESQMVRQYITPILDKHHVPLVINGHEHSYQRSLPIRAGKVTAENQGTVYVTTGGGGAELHPVGTADFLKVGISTHNFVGCDVNGGKLQFTAWDLNGAQLDAFSVTPTPVLNQTSVVNAADYTTGIAPGSLVSIFGLQLAPEDATSQKYPMPKSLGGATVFVNGEPIPIIMSSARQLNVQLPFGVSGTCDLTVRNPNGETQATLNVSAVAPAIFPGSLFHENGSPVSDDSPFVAGETLTIYATGLGELSQQIEAGTSPDAVTCHASVNVLLGNKRLTPQFAGSVKGVPGVYAVRFQVPSGGVASSLRLAVGDVASGPMLAPPKAAVKAAAA